MEFIDREWSIWTLTHPNGPKMANFDLSPPTWTAIRQLGPSPTKLVNNGPIWTHTYQNRLESVNLDPYGKGFTYPNGPQLAEFGGRGQLRRGKGRGKLATGKLVAWQT